MVERTGSVEFVIFIIGIFDKFRGISLYHGPHGILLGLWGVYSLFLHLGDTASSGHAIIYIDW